MIADDETMDRFWDKVTFSDLEGCWLWTACCDRDGYGQFRNRKKTVYAHRFSYEQHHGQIPVGFEVNHVCRIKSCVNPNHLEMLTPEEHQKKDVDLILAGNRAGGLKSRKSPLPEGVMFSGRKKNPFRVQIRLKGKRRHLGNFPTPEAAATAYKEARKIC